MVGGPKSSAEVNKYSAEQSLWHSYPKYIPELNPCIVVATTMSLSVITETACAPTHIVPPRQTVSSLFIVPNSLLVVEEALPFCTTVALISSKHLCFVHRRTCERNQNILHLI